MESLRSCLSASGALVSTTCSSAGSFCSNLGKEGSKVATSISRCVTFSCGNLGSTLSNCANSISGSISSCTRHSMTALSNCTKSTLLPVLKRIKDAAINGLSALKNWVFATPERPNTLLIGCAIGAAATILAFFCLNNCVRQKESSPEPIDSPDKQDATSTTEIDPVQPPHSPSSSREHSGT